LHCGNALQCTALQKLVPNFSGNEFAYGQQHIVFWLSAIVTAIESASWPFGQLASSVVPWYPDPDSERYLLFTEYRVGQKLMCVLASCEVAN